ncbi:hypothetical protein BGX23_002681 [Mortierella sp. AD031]|nr:hypothetical protein BGX23_002681 [Mortierella sp. AD031]
MSTPELVLLVTSFLERDDFYSFRSTCRAIHSICQPTFYRDARPAANWEQSSLEVLAKHAGVIRTLKMDQHTCSRYYKCMAVNPYEPAEPITLDSSPPILTPIDQFSDYSIRYTSPTQLAHILSHDMLLDPSCPEDHLAPLCRKDYFAAQLLYVIRASPCVTALDLGPLVLNTEFELTFLAKVLSSIGTLQSLALSVSSNCLSAEEVLSAFVLCCPPFVESFSLYFDPHTSAKIVAPGLCLDSDLNSYMESYSDDAVSLSAKMVSLWLGRITAYREPLKRLAQLRLDVNGSRIDVDTLVSLLEFLPELTAMDIPAIKGFSGLGSNALHTTLPVTVPSWRV